MNGAGKTLLDLLKRYRLLFLGILPVLLVSGAVSGTIAMLVLALVVIYFFLDNRHDNIILLFILILILGDSRQGFLQFVKNLRVEMLVFMTLITFWEIKQGVYRINKLFLWFFPFLMVSLIALSYSPLLDVGSTKTVSFTLLYFVSLHYIMHKQREFGIRFLGDMVKMGHLILLVGIILLPIAPGIVSYGGVRYNGLMGNPNGMGMLVTLLTPMTLYYFSKGDYVKKNYKTLAWSLIVVSLALCSSRNALFSFVIFFSLYYGLRGTLFTRLIFILVVMPVAGILIFNVDLEALVYALGLEKYLRVKEFQSGSGRIFAWRHAWGLIQERPLIGCGFACEEYNFIYTSTYELWSTGHQGGVHNSYLAFIVNTGFIGFSLYLAFLGNMFRKIKNHLFLFPFIGCVLFSGMFESWLFSSLSAFHILFIVMTTQMLVDRFLPSEWLRK